MPEIKNTFTGAKMNKDLDERLIPTGEYRDGLNVSVGHSEGGDVGAVENLKGNAEVAGQSSIIGTTIGTVRDANNDKIYWFTAGDTNSIYEYDQIADTISTIITDKTSRDAAEPTCAPDTRATITLPDGNGPSRPTLPDAGPRPLAYCSAGTATNTNQRADGSAANTAFDFVDNSICTFAPSFNCSGAPSYTCSNPGDGSGQFSTMQACTASCAAPPPPGGGGGGTPRTLTVTGCPTGPTTAATVTLTVTATAGWTTASMTNPINVMITGYTGPAITITSNTGSATFDVTNPGTDTNVVYTPSGNTNIGTSVRNTACSIAWGNAAPVVVTFACGMAVSAGDLGCLPNLLGTGAYATLAECEADCNPPVEARPRDCQNAIITNSGIGLLFTYVSCGIAEGGACSVTTINIGSRTPSTSECIVTNIDAFCAEFGGRPGGISNIFTLTDLVGGSNVFGSSVALAETC